VRTKGENPDTEKLKHLLLFETKKNVTQNVHFFLLSFKLQHLDGHMQDDRLFRSFSENKKEFLQ
jgi:hypothetical protein